VFAPHGAQFVLQPLGFRELAPTPSAVALASPTSAATTELRPIPLAARAAVEAARSVSLRVTTLEALAITAGPTFLRPLAVATPSGIVTAVVASSRAAIERALTIATRCPLVTIATLAARPALT
jgi:hypothetical protein